MPSLKSHQTFVPQLFNHRLLQQNITKDDNKMLQIKNERKNDLIPHN
jgi:hypothetical protein